MFFIYLTIFVNIIGFGMVFPLIPLYAKQFHATEGMIGVIMSSFAIAQFIFSPLWGAVSDRFGRKPVISMALLGLSASFFVFALAHNLTWLLISRFLQGVFSAAALPVAQAYVADVTTKEQRIKGMGNLGASLALGFMIGPAIGGILSGINLAFPFIASGVLAILNFISVQIFLPESLKEKSQKLELKGNFLNIKAMFDAFHNEMGALFIMIFLWSYAISNSQVAIPLLGYEHFGISSFTIGLFFSSQGMVAAFMQTLVVHKVAKRFGEHRTALIALIIMAVALILMPFSPISLMMAVFMMLTSVGSGLARPTLNSLISKETKEGQGTTMGLSTAFESFGRILGPLLGGILFSYDFRLPFIVCAIMVGLSLIYVLRYRHFLKN